MRNISPYLYTDITSLYMCCACSGFGLLPDICTSLVFISSLVFSLLLHFLATVCTGDHRRLFSHLFLVFWKLFNLYASFLYTAKECSLSRRNVSLTNVKSLMLTVVCSWGWKLLLTGRGKRNKRSQFLWMSSLCACVCMYVCIYIYMYMYVYICICMYMYAYICIYIVVWCSCAMPMDIGSKGCAMQNSVLNHHAYLIFHWWILLLPLNTVYLSQKLPLMALGDTVLYVTWTFYWFSGALTAFFFPFVYHCVCVGDRNKTAWKLNCSPPQWACICLQLVRAPAFFFYDLDECNLDLCLFFFCCRWYPVKLHIPTYYRLLASLCAFSLTA